MGINPNQAQFVQRLPDVVPSIDRPLTSRQADENDAVRQATRTIEAAQRIIRAVQSENQNRNELLDSLSSIKAEVRILTYDVNALLFGHNNRR